MHTSLYLCVHRWFHMRAVPGALCDRWYKKGSQRSVKQCLPSSLIMKIMVSADALALVGKPNIKRFLIPGLGRRCLGNYVYFLPDRNHGLSGSLFWPDLGGELLSGWGTCADRSRWKRYHHLHWSPAWWQGSRPQGACTQGLCPAEGLVSSTSMATSWRATQYT